MSQQKVYSSIIERIFLSKFKPGMREVDFERQDIARFGAELKSDLPKNFGGVIYSFRYRAPLPDSIQSTAGVEEVWIIRPAG